MHTFNYLVKIKNDRNFYRSLPLLPDRRVRSVCSIILCKKSTICFTLCERARRQRFNAYFSTISGKTPTEEYFNTRRRRRTGILSESAEKPLKAREDFLHTFNYLVKIKNDRNFYRTFTYSVRQTSSFCLLDYIVQKINDMFYVVRKSASAAI